jgi:hypothetical protein
MPTWALSLVVLVLSACSFPTRFEGDAKFPDGVAGCRRACASAGLELGGFVYSGEFATSCVCQPVTAAGAPAATAESSPTAGVVAQTQAAAAAAAAAASNSHQLRIQQQQQQQQRRRR